MMLSEIAQVTRGSLVGPDQDVAGVSIDSRSIKEGETFVALEGPNFNGHDYVENAQAAGAIAAIVQRKLEGVELSQVVVPDTHLALTQIAMHVRSAFKGKVAAITGSCGKTTVKGMLQAICNQAGGCIATKGNFNNLIGVPLSLLRLNNDVAFGVIEAGASVPGEIAALAEMIQADVAVVNNVMPTHVEGFGSIDKIAVEKTELFAALKADGIAVINLDDALANYFIERSEHTRKVGFTQNLHLCERPGFDEIVSADNVAFTDLGAPVFTLSVRGGSEKCQLKVIGEHNVTNALAASAMAVALGINSEAIFRGLEAFAGEPRRMQIREGLHGETIVDDSYNASPGSLKAAINYLKDFKNTALVLGDMGELGVEAAEIHREMGLYARQAGIAALYATGILAAETASAFGTGAIWCESQSELLEKLSAIENKNVIILVKGSRFTRMDKVADALSQKVG